MIFTFCEVFKFVALTRMALANSICIFNQMANTQKRYLHYHLTAVFLFCDPDRHPYIKKTPQNFYNIHYLSRPKPRSYNPSIIKHGKSKLSCTSYSLSLSLSVVISTTNNVLQTRRKLKEICGSQLYYCSLQN